MHQQLLENTVEDKLNVDIQTENIQTPWPESANELYWQSDGRLSAKLVPTCKDIGVAWSAQRIPTAVFSAF
jgi:hypothetical protein